MPTAGDSLIFPVLPDADAKVCLNDLVPGTQFAALQFLDNGYVISGSAIGLTGGFSASGSAEMQCAISLAASQSWTVAAGSTVLVSAGADLSGQMLTVSGSGALHFAGGVTGLGLGSALRKEGAGTLRLSGSASSFQGPTTLNDGLLLVEAPFASDVTVLGGRFVGNSAIHSLLVNQGQIAPGNTLAGRIEIGGDLTLLANSELQINLAGLAPGTQADQISVAGQVTIGGALKVTLAAGYVPDAGDQFVIIDNDDTDLVHGTFVDLLEGSVLAAGGLRFQITYSGGTGNDVVLLPILPAVSGVSRTWTGGASPDKRWTTAANWLDNLPPQPGDAVIFPDGPSAKLADNDFPAGTVFDAVEVRGSGYLLSGTAILLLNGVRGDLSGSSTFSQSIEFGPGAGIDVLGGGLVFSGAVIANDGMAKTGPGITRFSGTSANSIGKKTDVRAGTLELAKTAGLSAVSAILDIAPGATVRVVNPNQIPNFAPVTLGHYSGPPGSADPAWLEMLGSDAIGSLFLRNGNVSVASGQVLTVDGDLSVSAANSLSQIGGTGELIMKTSPNPRHWNIGGGSLEMEVSASGDDLIAGGAGSLTASANLGFGSFILREGTANCSGGAPHFCFDDATVRLSGLIFDLQSLSGGGVLEVAAPDGSPTGLTCDLLELNAATELRIPINGPTRDLTYSSITTIPLISNGDPPILDDARLILQRTTGAPLAVGEELVIIDNGGFFPVSGTFLGLDEGATFAGAGQTFSISYEGGDGNDVTITRMASPTPEITAFGISPLPTDPPGMQSGHAAVQGSTGLTFRLESSTDLVVWTEVEEVSADATGVAQFAFFEPIASHRRFYRIVPL